METQIIGGLRAATALVLLSAPSLAQQNVLFTQIGTAAGQRFGFTVTAVRDNRIDQPNHRNEFTVSSPFTQGTTATQRVDYFRFDPSLAPATVLVAQDSVPVTATSLNPEIGYLFGVGVDAVRRGGDGRLARALGAPGDIGSWGGRAMTSIDGGPVSAAGNGALGDGLGASCAALTDGFDTVTAVWGAPQRSTGSGYVVMSNAGPFSGLIPAPAGAGAFGQSMGAMPDIDGDGIDELIVGAPFGASGGSAYLYSGATISSGAPVLLATQNGQSGEQFGLRVGSAGDVDQDGTADYFASSANYQFGMGRLVIYSGATHTSIRQYNGVASGVVAAGRDVTGDFIPDVVIASPSTNRLAEVLDGQTGALVSVIARTGGDTSPVTSLALGDVNGDVRADVLIGQGLFSTPGLAQAGRAQAIDVVPNIGTEFCFSNAPTGAGVYSTLRGTGSALLASNNLTVELIGVLPGSAGLYVLGDATQNTPASGGVLGNICVSGSLGRYTCAVAAADASGVMALNIDWGNLPTPQGCTAPNTRQALVGETWTFQVLHSDELPNGTVVRHFSSALSVTVL